jgi:hypothetical protein
MRSLVNTVEILFLASVAPPFPYIGTRAVMFSFWSRCAYRDILCIDWCTMWGVGTVRVDSIMMTVDWFPFFL